MSSKTVGVFVDVGNLYHCVSKKFDGAKLNYKMYLDNVVSDGDIIYNATAYGVQVKDEAAKFIACLRHFGYEPKYRRPRIFQSQGRDQVRRIPWSVGISMDIVRIVSSNKLDTVVLGSSEPEFVDLVNWVKERGVRCIVASCGIPKTIREAANDHIEITESYLESSNPTE